MQALAAAGSGAVVEVVKAALGRYPSAFGAVGWATGVSEWWSLSWDG